MAIIIMKLMWMLLIFCSFSISSGEEYHIITSENDQCVERLCPNKTLSMFAATFSAFPNVETTLILHPGVHNLNWDLIISRVSSFCIFPHSSSKRVKVVCTNSAKLAFYYTDIVNINGVDFIGCVQNRVRSVKQFILMDSSFSGQTDVFGSALEITESSVNITKSEFYSNRGSKVSHSVKCQSSADYQWRRIHTKRVQATTGGAILSRRSRVSILQCMFKGNVAQVGGAIFCQYHSHITISDSIFEGNHATPLDQYKLGMCLGGGGVMHIESDSSVIIQRSCFIGNAAHYFGGAIDILHTHNAVLIIDNSSFTGNTAMYGGVLNVFGTYSTRITITNDCEFRDNNAKKDGGVIALLSNIYFWSAYAIKMNIAHCKFAGNKAGDHGGVMAISNTENSIVAITKSDFINSSAQKGGGVLSAGQNDKINISINESTFSYNEANKGGALMFYHNRRYINLAVYKNKFQGNIALTMGGSCYIEDQNLRIVVNESIFCDSEAEVGGAIFLYRGETIVTDSNFTNCSATSDGGGVYSIESDVCVVRTMFISNHAGKNGGTICSESGKIFINHTSFENSLAASGGTLHSQQTFTVINHSIFRGSRAIASGGTMYLERGQTNIAMNTIVCNSIANTGGVIRSHQSDLFISESKIFNNRAKSEGGVLKVEQGTVNINQTSFTNNRAHLGAVIWADHATIISNTVNIIGNQANSSVVYHMESTSNWSNVVFTSNTGSLCAVESIVTLRDIVMTDMQPTNRCRRSNLLEEGGAITAFQGMIMFHGLSVLTGNNASTGGAINAIEAKLYIHGNVTVVNNTALQNGGGVYLRQSVLTCQRNSTLTLMGNKAVGKGGGIHAVGSSIKINGTLVERNYTSLQFIGNDAEEGGGLHLQMDAKLYILKSKPYTEKYRIVTFTANSADHGGAVYVADDNMCSFNTRSECFFQSLALYNALPSDSVHQSVHFSNNTAVSSGESLYGGLLDRCTINPLAETDRIHLDSGNDSILLNDSDSVAMKGSEYLHMMSNIKNSEIGSPPIRVCFCRDGQPDCSYQPDPIFIRKGHLTKVPLSLVVLDQINRPLEKAKIYNRLSSGLDLCQHHIHSTDGNCSLLHFAAFSNNETEELILFTDGPCKDAPDCQCKIKLEVFCPHCPVGFELKHDEEGCRCDCDSKLKPFISECSLPTQTIMRKKNCWITNITTENNSSDYQYLVYPHCPLDYCYPARARMAINLNTPNGSNTQCANGHSGLLCGTCQPGLSLSLGSSHCIPCSTRWPAKLAAIVIAAFIAGIILVALVLVLNLTVAVGSLNGIIFYANVVAANSNIFFPFSRPNFATAFISWFNLEIGFDICFFDGLNSLWKTFLQLVFPAYIFLLVIIVIIFSEISSKFSKLIAKRNPVATLATLVLISYAKFLHTIIASLSFAVLHYPDGSRRVVWLPNASIGYLQGKHTALFVVAILILLVGLVYTFLLFSWQWLLRHKHRKLFKWMRYQKLCHFIEPYHAPYTVKHRYWTGLLLFVRVFLYIISAINIFGDPRVSLVTIISVVTTLQLIKGTFAKNLYKALAVDIVETIMFFNLIILSTATLYTFDTTQNQIAVAYVSVLITFVLFLAILTFHIYKYAGLHLLCQKSKAFRVISTKLSVYYNRRSRDNDSISDGQFAEDQPPRLHATCSVVELRDLPSPED